MNELPEWMKEHIQDARGLFGVGGAEWHITARLSDKPAGSKGFDGSCWADATYLNAEIELNEDLPDDENGKEKIYHEVLHVAHQEIDQMAFDAMSHLPKRERKIYRNLYEAAVERFNQRISRSICARLAKQ